jgi:hypothetical protein
MGTQKHKIQSITLKKNEHLVDLIVDRRIILELILKKWGVRVWNDSSGSGYGPVADPSEYSNKLSASVISWERCK